MVSPSVEAFEARLVDWGTTLEELRTERRRDMLIATLIDADVTPRVAVGDEAARAFYDQHPDQFAEAEALQASPHPDRIGAGCGPRRPRRRAGASGNDSASGARRRIRLRLARPGNTPTTARRHRAAATSDSSRGGRPSRRSRRLSSPSIPGRSARSPESQFGFHVIRAGDRREARVIPFEEAGGGIRRMLVAQARQALTGEFIARLRADGEIETYL